MMLLPIAAHAYDAKIDGIYYNFSGDEAEVTYESYRDSYGHYESSYALNVVIPNSVNYNGKTYSVTSIGSYAFDHCSGVKSVTIPESVIKIGGDAFRGCSGLTSIIIPESVTSIGDRPFEGCSSLHYNEYNNARYLGNDNNPYYAIITSKSTNITSCEISTMCKLVGGGAFEGCTSLTSITIPENVVSIGESAFRFCYSLTSVSIGNSVTSIGGYAFENCSSLTTIIIPNSVTHIGFHSFSASGLTSITIPCSVLDIDYHAFSYCESLVSITIPNSVTAIGARAFYSCSKLTSVTISSSVTSIGEFAFQKCTSLTDVYCYAETVPNTGSNAFEETNITSATLHVPAASVETYKTIVPWSSFGNIVPLTYTITYIVDREVYRFYEIEEGASITPEPAPTKEGYTFSGWSEIPETMPDHDVTVTGSFVPNNYTLTYIVDGQVYQTYSVAYGSTITPEPAPTKVGYTFSGWSYIPTTMPATDVVVMGTFTINSYTLTYKVDGQVYKTYSVEYGSAITPEPEPIKEGYTFSGWSTIPATMPARNVTVTGTFTKDILGTCSTPTISYVNGELTFNSETEGVTFHYDIDIEDNEIKSGSSDKVQLSVTYHISVYATKEDYYDSEVATGTLCWIDQQPSTEGIIAEDAVTEVKALPVLIQSNGGTITVQGANEGTEIMVYSVNGMKQGSAIATQGFAVINTSLQPGSVAIVKIGEKSVKVLVK